MKKIFFDVGANNGRDSIHIANNPDWLVYGFEPTPHLINQIKDKIKNKPNYILVEKAVSDFVGTSQFNIAGQRDWGCSSLLEFSDKSKTKWPGRTDFKVTETIQVEVITLEKFIKENQIPAIDFLHIDTQGSDLNVLKGLGEYINIVKQGVMEAGTEDDILYYGQNTKNECIEFLTSNGFKIDNIKSNDRFNNEINIRFSKDLSIPTLGLL